MPPPWKDLHTPDTQQWVGLEFTVAPRPRPSWRVEAAAPHHLRLMRAEQPLLWARVTPGYTALRWLLGTGEHPGCPLPLQARDVDALSDTAGSPAWFAAWARHFIQALDETPDSPLHEGTWRLMRAEPIGRIWHPGREALAPDLVEDMASGSPQVFATDEHFHFRSRLLGLRLETQLSPSRLKVWRKRARAGTLPPVLALSVSPLCAYVVLDGHHRWRAALDEQCPVPLLSLSFIRAWPHAGGTDPQEQQRVERIFHAGSSPARSDSRPISVERLNELALEAWDNRPWLNARTRAWPQPGGLPAWRTEVRERLSGLGDVVPGEFTDSFLAPEP